MRVGGILAVLAAIVIAVFAWYMIDIDQTQEARLPDVDVNVEGGQAPEFEAEVGSVDVGTTERQVTVPEVEVTTEERTIELPTVDIKSPEEEAAEAGGAPEQDTN